MLAARHDDDDDWCVNEGALVRLKSLSTKPERINHVQSWTQQSKHLES